MQETLDVELRATRGHGVATGVCVGEGGVTPLVTKIAMNLYLYE